MDTVLDRSRPFAADKPDPWSQTIHQARAEAGRQVRLASSDECVLPDIKAHLRLQQREDKDASSSPMLRHDRVSQHL